MKQPLLMLSAVCLLIVASCSKSSDSPEQEQAKNEMTVNGAVYGTTVIGNQTWTTVNYNGSGGVNYNDEANDPRVGKLYTLAESKAIVLPAGWRLPSRDDYNKLLGTLGETAKDSYGFYSPSVAVTKKLMATSSWNNYTGTNESGFNCLATGIFRDLQRTIDAGFNFKGTETAFITTSFFTEYGIGWDKIPVSFDIYLETLNGSTEVHAGFSDSIVENSDKGSIRFVKDN